MLTLRRKCARDSYEEAVYEAVHHNGHKQRNCRKFKGQYKYKQIEEIAALYARYRMYAEQSCLRYSTDAPGIVSPRLVSGIEVDRDLLHFEDALSTEE